MEVKERSVSKPYKGKVCPVCQSAEDRSLRYKRWIRDVKHRDGSFPMDIDMFVFRNTVEGYRPVAITEITRCDHETVTQGYLDAVRERYTVKDVQGSVVRDMSQWMGIPAYLVCYQKYLKWFWVYGINDDHWQFYTKDEWANFLGQL